MCLFSNAMMVEMDDKPNEIIESTLQSISKLHKRLIHPKPSCARVQEMYLPHLIRSALKQLQQGETDQTLLSFVDAAMRVEERKKLLESHYSQELSLLYILQEDYDRAKYYANCAMELFMEVSRRRESLPPDCLSVCRLRVVGLTVPSVFGPCRITPAWTR